MAVTSPTIIKNTIALDTDGGEFKLAPLNYPKLMPANVLHEIIFTVRHGFVIHFQSQYLQACSSSSSSSSSMNLSDTFANTTSVLCIADAANTFQYQSYFHILKITYGFSNYSTIFGKLRAVKGEILHFSKLVTFLSLLLSMFD